MSDPFDQRNREMNNLAPPLEDDDHLWAEVDAEMAERTEHCPKCGGVGEVLSWSTEHQETDLLTCGKCEGWGRFRPKSQ